MRPSTSTASLTSEGLRPPPGLNLGYSKRLPRRMIAFLSRRRPDKPGRTAAGIVGCPLGGARLPSRKSKSLDLAGHLACPLLRSQAKGWGCGVAGRVARGQQVAETRQFNHMRHKAYRAGGPAPCPSDLVVTPSCSWCTSERRLGGEACAMCIIADVFDSVERGRESPKGRGVFKTDPLVCMCCRCSFLGWLFGESHLHSHRACSHAGVMRTPSRVAHRTREHVPARNIDAVGVREPSNLRNVSRVRTRDIS